MASFVATIVHAATLLHPHVPQPDGGRLWPQVADWMTVVDALAMLARAGACDALALGLTPLQALGDPFELAWPLTGDERIAEHLPEWGERIFQALLGSSAAHSAFVRVLERANGSSGPRPELLISSAPADWLAVPWELLSDPSASSPMVLRDLAASRTVPDAGWAESFAVVGERLRVLMAACCLGHVRFPCSPNGQRKVGAAMTGNKDVVIGVDLGTTSSKAVAFTVDGTAVGSGQVGYRLRSRRPGYAEQDADEVRNSALEATAEAIRKATDGGYRVAGLAFSAAMHSLIGLDATGFPLTPVLTWADGRAAEQAARLRADPRGLALHKRTGTPVHPMSPLVKLRWFAENQPDVAALVGQWVGIKEYLLRRLTGELVVDHGIASATGMFNLRNDKWDDEALAYAGISAAQLPEPVRTTASLPLSREGATLLGLAAGTPLILGSSDGPLANLGLGAVRPGDVACSIGTSGAVRVVADQPLVDDRGRVFCYVLAPDRYVIGGAVNNGGIVLEWLGEAVAPDLDGGPPQLLDLAAAVPAGCGGLLFLPYLMGERAPHWSGQPRGVYLGLTREHRREHLLRAALEGVCLQLALVLASLGEAGVDVRGIRATGGFSRSTLWRQILAATFGRPIGFASSPEGSSLGAALLGMASLGLLGSLDEAAELVRVTDSTHPDRAATEAYARLLPVFDRVYDALVPTFADLTEAAQHLPVKAPVP